MYDLHSGWRPQHFSDWELGIGCTKPKVGSELNKLVKYSRDLAMSMEIFRNVDS